jgi:hypothetical protein
MSGDTMTHDNVKTGSPKVHENENGLKNGLKHLRRRHENGGTPTRKRAYKYNSPNYYASPTNQEYNSSPQQSHFRRQPFALHEDAYSPYRHHHYVPPQIPLQPPIKHGSHFALVSFGRGRKQYVYNR